MADRLSIIAGLEVDKKQANTAVRQLNDILDDIEDVDVRFSLDAANKQLNQLKKELEKNGELAGQLLSRTTSKSATGLKNVTDDIKLATGAIAHTTVQSIDGVEKYSVKLKESFVTKKESLTLTQEEIKAVKNYTNTVLEQQGEKLENFAVQSKIRNENGQEIIRIEKTIGQGIANENGQYQKQLKLVEDILITKNKSGVDTYSPIGIVKSSEAAKKTSTASTSAQEAAAIERYQLKVKELMTSVEKLDIRLQSTSTTLNTKFVTGEHHANLDKYTKEANDLISTMRGMDTSTLKTAEDWKIFTQSLKNNQQALDIVNTKVNETGRQIKDTGKYALNMGVMIKNAFKGFSIWMSVTTVFYQGIAAIKSGITAVTELDASLVSFNKVADVTDTQLQSITTRAYEMGKGLAQTGTAVLDATTDFVQAGYNVEDSLSLAQNAMILMNVGEVELADATDVLISATENYNIVAQDSVLIADKLNEVSNTTSAEVGNLADGLQRTAGQLAQTGTTMDENLGLLAAGFTTLRNMEKVSSGLITIASRLNRVDSATGELNAEFPKLEKTFNGIGMTLMDSNGELKSTYDILQELSKIYPSLNSLQQANLNFLVSGSRQGNVLTAILNEFNIAEQAVTDSLNSQNSAIDENTKRIDSIDGKVRILQSSWQEMWSQTIDSDFIKGLLNIAVALIKVTKEVGLLNIALFVTLTVLSATKLQAGFTNMYAALSELIPVLGSASTALTGVGLSAAATNAILTGGILIGVFAIVKAFDIAITTADEYEEKIQKLATSITTLKDKLTELQEKQQAGEDVNQKDIDYLEARIKLEDKVLQMQEKRQAKVIASGEGLFGKNSQTEAAKNYISTYETLMDLHDKYLEKVSNADTSEIDKQFYGDLADNTQDLDAIKNKLYEYYDTLMAVKGVLGTELPTATQKTIDKLAELLGMTDTSYTAFMKFERDVPNATDALVNSFVDFTGTIEDASNAIDDYQSSLSGIEDIYTTLNEGEKLSHKQLLDLIQTYPEYSQQIIDANGNKESGILLAQALFEAEKSRATAAIEANKQILLGEQEILKVQKESAYASLKEAQAAYDGGMINIGVLNAMKESYAAANQAFSTSALSVASLTNAQKIITGYSYEDFKKDSTKTTTTKTDSGTEEAIKSLEAYFDITQAIAKKQAEIEKVKTMSEIEGVDKTTDIVKLLTDEQKLLTSLNNARKVDLSSLQAKLKLNAGNVELIEQIAELESNIRDSDQEIRNLYGEKVDLLQAQKDKLQEIAELEKTEHIEGLRAKVELYNSQVESIDSLVESTEALIKSEKEAQKEWINDQKEALSLLKDEADYKDDLADKSKSVADIQNKLNLASRDKSQAGLAKTAQLQEELDEATKDLATTQADHQVEEQQRMYDEEIELIDDYLSETGKITADAIDRINADMQSGTSSLMTQLIDWNAKYGTSIQTDITDMWASAKTAMADYNNQVTSSKVGLTAASASTTARADALEAGGSYTVADIREKMMANSAAWKSTSDTNLQKQYADENNNKYRIMLQDLGTDITRGKDGAWYYTGTTNRFYDRGGEASGLGYMAKNTLSPERVLSPEQTVSFNKLVDMMPSLLSMVGGRITPISSGTSSSNINLTMPIMIEGNATSDTVSALKAQTKIIADTVLNQINSSFSTNGQYKLRTS